MSDGSDNPILDMGLLGMMQPNPYLNPAYANKPLALPGFYTGSAGSQPPIDAMGNPGSKASSTPTTRCRAITRSSLRFQRWPACCRGRH